MNEQQFNFAKVLWLSNLHFLQENNEGAVVTAILQTAIINSRKLQRKQ